MKSVWVLGAGKFGLKAVDRLRTKHPGLNIMVVDKKREVPGAIVSAEGVEYVRRDGIEFLIEKLKHTGGPDWIIPAIPVHVASKWIKSRLSTSRDVRDIDLPGQIRDVLPNTLQGADGELYSSMADFLCPDDCSEPFGVCAVTKAKRPYRLYDLLASIELEPFKTVVVKSRQLCAGAGGYRPADLFSALKEARRNKGPVLLSTSCKCHAIISAFC